MPDVTTGEAPLTLGSTPAGHPLPRPSETRWGVQDVLAVAWKEWREILSLDGGKRRGARLLNLAPFSLLIPAVLGRAIIESPLAVPFFVWFPVFVALGLSIDAVAGERERHTLETLLASRLPDRAILLGKVAAVGGYAWGIVLVSALLGLLAANLVHAWDDGPMAYPRGVALGILIFGGLVPLLVAAAAVLVSIRAPTVQAVQGPVFVGMLVLLGGGALVRSALPEDWTAPIADAVVGRRPLVAAAGAAALLALDTALLAAALGRFRRGRVLLG